MRLGRGRNVDDVRLLGLEHAVEIRIVVRQLVTCGDLFRHQDFQVAHRDHSRVFQFPNFGYMIVSDFTASDQRHRKCSK